MPHFHGYERTSPITGEKENHYDDWKRWVWHYPISLLVTSLMLLVAFAVMSLSLNFQGYVHKSSPIFVPSLAHFAEPGGVFEASSTCRSLVPVLCHTTAIMALNSMYKNVAQWLTKRENHKWHNDHE